MTSRFNDDHLRLLTQMNQFQIGGWLRSQVKSHGNKSHDYAMTILRELQIALSAYSKRNKEVDRVQIKMLAVNQKIEKWIRLAYIEWKTVDLIKNNSDLTKSPESVKEMAKQSYEKFYIARRY